MTFYKRYALSAVLALSIFTVKAGDTKKAEAAKAEKAENKAGFTENAYQELNTFIFVMQLLRDNYVDKDKVTFKKLFNGALKGMLDSLDKYSTYQSPEEFKKMVNRNSGKFVGIGVTLSYKKKFLMIESVEYGSPADRADLKPGDAIVGINGRAVKKMSFAECVNNIKGKVGTKVKIKYSRKGKYTKVEITREVINNPPIPTKGVKYVADGIGYIRVTHFSMSLPEELDIALDKLKKKKLESLIIDLRGNPGGLLLAAVRFCSFFVKEGKLIVKIEGRKKSESAVYKSYSCDHPLLKTPIVILIDHGSASASEIVAGCLHDYKRAILVGTKSYGKGLVQKIQRLTNGSGIKYTSALYFTPSHNVIQGKGIEPDIKVEPGCPRRKLMAQIAKYPGVIEPDSDNSVVDVQLQRAVEILKGINLLSEENR